MKIEIDSADYDLLKRQIEDYKTKCAATAISIIKN
jgi:hypothetical protein